MLLNFDSTFSYEVHYTVFGGWDVMETELVNHPDEPDNLTLKAVVFTGNNSSVTAQYYTSITVDSGNLSYDNNQYILSAPKFKVDENTIWKFNQWTTDTPESVNFLSATDQQSEVFITGSNVIITAEYRDQLGEWEADEGNIIFIDEDLVLPPGGVYAFPQSRKLQMTNGKRLTIAGTTENPVIMKGQTGVEWGGIHIDGARITMGYAVVEDAINGVKIEVTSNNGGNVDYNINNCIFVSNFNGIIWSSINGGYELLTINNCIFSENNTAVMIECTGITLLHDVGYSLFHNNIHDIIEIPNSAYNIHDNLFESPDFVNLVTGDYHLQPSSPCIDAGVLDFDGDGETWETDIDDQDPDDTRMDIGAYYYDQLMVPTLLSISGEIGENPVLTWQFDTFNHYQHHEVWRYYETLETDGFIKAESNTGTFTDQDYVISRIDEEPDGRTTIKVTKVDPGTGDHQRVNYQVRAVNQSNQPYQYSNEVHTYRLLPGSISKETGLLNNLPTEYALKQNYPNPFNPITTIEFDVPEDGFVTLVIYDLSGRIVIELINGFTNAGRYKVMWNGINNLGEPVPSGMYLYQLKSDGFVERKKLVLLK